MSDWLNLFAAYRVVSIRNDEVVQGVLHPGTDPDDPAVRATLDTWEGQQFVKHTPAGTEVTLIRRTGRRPAERWWLHAILLLLTLLSTTAAGALLFGHDAFGVEWFAVGSVHLPLPTGIEATSLLLGLAFSLPLLLVLLGHELGHYLVARRHGMDVSPPFFIPSPPAINVIGTFGAFIRLRSPVLDRRVLLDVGAAGPLASFVLSIPVVAAGLVLSRAVSLTGDSPAGLAVLVGAQPIWLGGSLLFDGFVHLFAPEGGMVILHPLAFAGWLGWFVTALNLLPLAQLDGGHVLYALLGRRQRYVGLGFMATLLVLGNWWWGWWLWAVLILLIGRGSVRHPSVLDPSTPVTGGRRWIGWLCLLIFVGTFVVVPLRV